MNYVYFAKSLKNGKVYIGYTSKAPELRITEHNSGSNRWSDQNKPFTLIYYESYYCEQDARLKERFYKSGFGRKIKNIIISNLGP